MTITRKPAAAGSFYPRFKSELLELIKENFLNSEFGPGKELKIGKKDSDKQREVIGGITPHAGYTYSGSAAGMTFQQIFKEGAPDTIIILGNQHTGYREIGIMKDGNWETPFGKIQVDCELAEIILKECKDVNEDDSAFNGFPHGREHNIEVQLPFIQYASVIAQKSIKILPIKIGIMNQETLLKLGKGIAQSIKKTKGKDIALIASSDMTHYEPKNEENPKKEIHDNQYKKDENVIKAFINFDWKKVFETASETSVCGPQTIFTLMIVANELGYKKPRKLGYYTSYEKLGDKGPSNYSVGYFSGIIEKD